MVQASHRATDRGPTFIRLLARLTDIDVPQTGQSLSDRLSQWLDWTHAIALSTALDGKPAALASEAPAFGSAEEGECARVRASLAQAVASDPAFAPTGPAEQDAMYASADDALFRQRYIALQRSMQATTGQLRGRLRDMLAHKSADMARLAAVDAALELSLSPREQTLLGTVPALLSAHFECLRQAEEKMLADAHASKETLSATPGAWLDTFRKDMQSVLLAELDVRFQPIEGLLAALRSRPL